MTCPYCDGSRVEVLYSGVEFSEYFCEDCETGFYEQQEGESDEE